MIIAFSGYAGSGKDAAANIIRSMDPSFEIKKFSAKLKLVASILTGIPAQKFEDQEFKRSFLGEEWGSVQTTPLNNIAPFSDIDFNVLMSIREFLQKLGTDAIRDRLHKDAWVNALMADYIPPEMSENNSSRWVITDCRFPNEAAAVKQKRGVVVRIVRSEVDPVNSHPSETALDNWKYDYVIKNDGSLEDLRGSIENLLKQVNERNNNTSAVPR